MFLEEEEADLLLLVIGFGIDDDEDEIEFVVDVVLETTVADVVLGGSDVVVCFCCDVI